MSLRDPPPSPSAWASMTGARQPVREATALASHHKAWCHLFIFCTRSQRHTAPSRGMCRHAFLQELRDLEEAENTKYVRSVSEKGALVLNRRLPPHLADKLPTELIPKHILRLFALWQRGELQRNKQADVLRYHDTVAVLCRC